MNETPEIAAARARVAAAEDGGAIDEELEAVYELNELLTAALRSSVVVAA